MPSCCCCSHTRPGMVTRQSLPLRRHRDFHTPVFDESAGIDGILSEMVKDGFEVLHSGFLVNFNLMLAGHFPKQLSVGLIIAVYKSGDKSDMSNYRAREASQ